MLVLDLPILNTPNLIVKLPRRLANILGELKPFHILPALAEPRQAADGRNDDGSSARHDLVELGELLDCHVTLLDGHAHVLRDRLEALIRDRGQDRRTRGSDVPLLVVVDPYEVTRAELLDERVRGGIEV